MCALREVQVESVGRSPSFFMGCQKQRGTLDSMQKREQQLCEGYQKNKPLCFNAKAYQKTHPRKAAQGYKDADATLISPMLVGVADGVSQIEEFGIDASELPNELLDAVEELAVSQLLPEKAGQSAAPLDAYRGPISMLRQAYEATESLGSTTVLMAVMDNSTRIHGKLHPMIAVLSIGDCELLILRRKSQGSGKYEQMFHTEMQRIDGNAQSPLQLARVDENIDPQFEESMAIEVIERGSAVQCVSAYEGDIVVLGSDGVFDNMYLSEILDMVNDMLPEPYPYAKFAPTDRNLLGRIARRIVRASHAKTHPGAGGVFPDAPIGRGGKSDDTSCVVGEVVEWTAAHSEAWVKVRRQKQWSNMFSCGLGVTCNDDSSDEEQGRQRSYPQNPNASQYDNGGGSFGTVKGGSFTTYRGTGAGGSFLSSYAGSRMGSFSEYGGSYIDKPDALRTRRDWDQDEEERQCSVM